MPLRFAPVSLRRWQEGSIEEGLQSSWLERVGRNERLCVDVVGIAHSQIVGSAKGQVPAEEGEKRFVR